MNYRLKQDFVTINERNNTVQKMKTINDSGRGPKIKIKKSIFITTIFHISSQDEAQQHLIKIQEEFRKATHNAYAFRLGNPISWEESSDDGEVKGCAGKPIMNILQKQELTNILVVVTRFYGGVKLGPGGLIRAYSKSAAGLIKIIGLKEL